MSAPAAEGRFGYLLRLLRPPTREGASPSPTLSLRLWGPAADFDGTLYDEREFLASESKLPDEPDFHL